MVTTPDKRQPDDAVKQALRELIPAGVTQELLRNGQNVVCIRCGIPKPRDLFEGDSTVCNGCMPRLIEHARMIADKQARGQIASTIAKLQRESQPATITGVERVLERMDEEGTSVAEETYSLFRELTLKDASPEEREFRRETRQHGHEVSLLRLLQQQMDTRDESLYGQNPYKDLSEEDLLGTALQGIVEEASANPEFAEVVATALVTRVPHFAQTVYSLSDTEIVEAGGVE